MRKGIRRGRQAQFFGSQTAYALAVHGQLHGFNGRDHGGHASRFYVCQGGSIQRLDFRHDKVRLFFGNQGSQRGIVCHVYGVSTVRHLLAGGIVVTVNGYHFHP